jgi:5-methylcytosine-specific restriction endonuclease McrA
MNIKHNPTPYAQNVKKTGKKMAGQRLIDNGDFYRSRPWRKARAEWIKLEPLCVHCLKEGKHTPGDVVDHRTPIVVDESLKLDPDNLQTLCHDHHSKKSQEDKKKWPEIYGSYDHFYFG